MTFHCTRCGTKLGGEVKQEEIDEYEANFPGEKFSPGESCDPVCDKCYEEFWKWAEHGAPELERKYGR